MYSSLNELDQNVRDQATRLLEKACEENLGEYMIVLCQELVNEQRDVHVRMAAGLSVKNSLVSKDAERRARLGEKWRGLGCSVRTQIKQLVLQGLTAQDGKAGTAAAQVVSAIAFIELPADEWPELMGVLLENVTGAGKSAGIRRATLEAIGFICEQIDPEVLQSKSSEILTAVINGLRSAETSTSVRVAAAHALLNSVDFIRRHFESASEAAVIMQVVCEATVAPDEVLAVAAFECLNELVRVYYELMGPFVPAGVAQMAIGVLGSSQSDAILLQATEFWSTLAEIERDLDPGLCSEGTTDSLYFVRRFSKELLPSLLRLLQQQPSEESTDEWCPSMAASTCLGLVAESLGDAILTDNANAIPAFIDANINGPNWRQRESAVMALGSILDGPQTDILAPLVGGLTRRLLELLANDQSVAVQDSAAWALGRICDFHLGAVPADLLPIILQGLVHCLALAPRVSVNCCWSLMTLCTHLGAEDDSVPTSEVSSLFDSITSRLVATADRSDADECNLRSAAYQSLAAVLLNAPADTIVAVSAFQEPLLVRLETALGHLRTAVVNADDRNRLVDLLSHLCTVMQSAIKKCRGPKTMEVADRTMQVALSLLQAVDNTKETTGAELEDVLLLVGVLATEMDQEFVRFYSFLVPVLCKCIARHEETAFCMVAVGVVGDLARSLGPLLQPQTDQLMMSLLEGLNSSGLHRSVKPHIISAIGDICLAIGASFQPYLTVTATFLQQAATVTPADPEDYDEIDFCLDLRESLLEAYTCIVQGVRQDSDGSALVPLVPGILSFLQLAATDLNRTEAMARSIAGLLGDLVNAFPSHAASFKAPWVSSFLQRPLPDDVPVGPQTVSVIHWAQQQLLSH